MRFFHFCYFLRFFLSFCFYSYYLHRNLRQSLTQNFPRFSVSCFARARSLSFFFPSVKAHFYFFSLPISSFKYIFVIQLLKFSAFFFTVATPHLSFFLSFSFLSFFFYFFYVICQSYFFFLSFEYNLNKNISRIGSLFNSMF